MPPRVDPRRDRRWAARFADANWSARFARRGEEVRVPLGATWGESGITWGHPGVTWSGG